MSHALDSESNLDPVHRRAPLITGPNPAPRLDYRVTLSARLVAGPGPTGDATIIVDYVPDRLLLDPTGLSRYMTGLSGLPWPGPEALGVAILDDINNEIVPRWVRVTVRTMAGRDGRTGPSTDESTPRPPQRIAHRVVLEDRQPHWNQGADAGFGDAPSPMGRG